jgi:hypothetical protein
MAFRWVDTNGKKGRDFATTRAAREDAIREARRRGGVSVSRAARPLDSDLEATLWKALSDIGWHIEFGLGIGGHLDAAR